MRLSRHELWRDENLGRHLLHAFRRFERELLRRLADGGYSSVRTVHLRVMRQVDMDGTRVSTLAERAGVTKQAMSQLIAECLRLNLVRMVPDPSDHRAKNVRFTSFGAALIESARSIIVDLERDLAKVLGRSRNERLRSALLVLAEAYHPGDPPRVSRANGHRILPSTPAIARWGARGAPRRC